MSDADKILKEIYKNEIDCKSSLPIPATDISKATKISLSRTKNILHKLQNEGLVRFQRAYMKGNLNEKGFFYCGWEITERGKGDNVFKNMKQEYEEERNK